MAKKNKFIVKIDLDKDVVVRQASTKEDVDFIFDSWLKSYKNSDFGISIPNSIYYENHRKMINNILTQENNAVAMMCDPEDTSVILGYIVYNSKDPIVFYTYVKYSFRGLGLGRYLLEGVRKNFGKNTEIFCTHKLKKWKLSKPLGLVYNPYLIKEFSDAISSKD